MLFFPWYPAMMLAVEANNVIDIRLRRIADGRVNAATETQLMISEKIDAIVEAAAIMTRGGNPLAVIDNYRRYVAANAARLAE